MRLALVPKLATRLCHLHCHIALALSVSIEFVYSSARVTSLKSAKGETLTRWVWETWTHRSDQGYLQLGIPGSDKNLKVFILARLSMTNYMVSQSQASLHRCCHKLSVHMTDGWIQMLSNGIAAFIQHLYYRSKRHCCHERKPVVGCMWVWVSIWHMVQLIWSLIIQDGSKWSKMVQTLSLIVAR